MPDKVYKKAVFRTAKSEFNPWTVSDFPQSQMTYNLPGLPTEWVDTVKLCNFFYEREGLVRTIIDKQVEIGMNDLTVIPENEDEELHLLFKYITNSVGEFLSQAATEYYLSGLVVPDIVWGTLAKEDSGLTKDYEIPTDLWVKNPLQVDLRQTPLPNRVIPVWEVSSDEVSFIVNKGKFDDGSEDKETYEMLKRDFPDFVKEVQKGKTTFALTDAYVIRRKPLYRSQYPIPYLMPALELLMHKRNLRKMDYALAGRVINAILHVKLGNDDYPITEDDYDLIEDLENEFRRRGNINQQERIMEFFTNHTVEMRWVTPDLAALLDTNKYDQINQEILYALGFPEFLITGEKKRSNSGSSDSALLSPLNSMKSLRRDFKNFLFYLFNQIAERNNFSEVPSVDFAPLNLINLNELISVAQTMETSGVVSKSSLAKLAGFDFNIEQRQRVSDNELMSSLGLESKDVEENNVNESGDDSTESESE